MGKLRLRESCDLPKDAQLVGVRAWTTICSYHILVQTSFH